MIEILRLGTVGRGASRIHVPIGIGVCCARARLVLAGIKIRHQRRHGKASLNSSKISARAKIGSNNRSIKQIQRIIRGIRIRAADLSPDLQLINIPHLRILDRMCVDNAAGIGIAGITNVNSQINHQRKQSSLFQWFDQMLTTAAGERRRTAHIVYSAKKIVIHKTPVSPAPCPSFRSMDYSIAFPTSQTAILPQRLLILHRAPQA